MTAPEGPGHSATLRLFFGLPLPDDVAAGLAPWQRETFGRLHEARVVRPEHLHLTLAFLGGRPAGELPELLEALHEAGNGARAPVLNLRRYRETENVAMLVFDDEGGHAGDLQEQLVRRLEALGVYRRERRPWLPHLTVARVRTRPRLHPELPKIAPFTPSQIALYRSLLRPSGALYEIVEAVAVG